MTTRRTFHILAASALAAFALAAEAKPKAVLPPPDPAVVAVQTLDPAVAAAFDAAIAGAHRSPENKARDQYRHPKEALAFFGLRPDMRVLEFNPGGGWFTEVLAPIVRERGQLYVTGGDVNSVRGRAGLSAQLDKYAKAPTIYDKVQFTGAWQAAEQRIQPGSLDMVVTFRNVHNLAWRNAAEQSMKDWYSYLKPGGVLGVEEHRWPEDKPNTAKPEKTPTNGYLKESEVIAFATAAGFKLVAKSEVGANPKDTKDYPNGVWTLPPVLTIGDVDMDKYLAIGESDRMTLKFVKPAS